MPARRRPSSRSPLNEAVRAGRSALKKAEKRIPPDLRRHIERSITDGQKRFDAAVKEIRTRVTKATAPGEIDRALKRFGDLSKQVESLARDLTARAASATGRAPARRAAPRRAATRVRKAPAARRKPAAAVPTPRKPAPRRASPRRRRAAPAVVVPPPAAPEPPAEAMGSGQG